MVTAQLIRAIMMLLFVGVQSGVKPSVANHQLDRPKTSPRSVLTTEADRVPKSQATFRDCAEDCPEMIFVPGGSFLMGSPVTEAGRNDNEGPLHKVTITKPFAVSEFDVTFLDWDACVSSSGCDAVSDDTMGRGSKPVVDVSWDQAHQYVAWLSRRTGQSYRLLTEAEWEYAARAGSSTAYPWGNEIGRDNANCRGCGSPWDTVQTSPVGSFTPNAFGLFDMQGNVWQWVEDCYKDSYSGAPADGSILITDICNRRVVRGGSWFTVPRYVRSAYRFGLATAYSFNDLGFRVARSLDVVASNQGGSTDCRSEQRSQ
jgi:formylglycine-generating enzyme required for sulfatase activity